MGSIGQNRIAVKCSTMTSKIICKLKQMWQCVVFFFFEISHTFPLRVGPFSLRLSPFLEPSSTMVALEWTDVEPLIGCKVSDYIIQHKRVEDPSEAEVYTGISNDKQQPHSPVPS